MADKGEVWKRIVEKHGLRKTAYDKLATWKFAGTCWYGPAAIPALSSPSTPPSVHPSDFVFTQPGDWFSNVNKLRQTGFSKMCVDTDEMFVHQLQGLRDARIIP